MKAARWRSRCVTVFAQPDSTGFVTCWPAGGLTTSTWRTSGWAGPWHGCPRCAGARSNRTTPGWEPAGYANRAVDQGIGRALWFVNGSDVQGVAKTIGAFPQSRQSDLWSGVGLASVYAGGADAGELSDLTRLAGPYRSHAAQGAAFAAKARLLAGLVLPGTELGVKVHCGMSVEEAAAVSDDARHGLPPEDAGLPSYEVWRDRIRKRFE